MSIPAVRPAGPARQEVFASVPATGRQGFYNAAIGRGLFGNCGAHVLRRSRVATVPPTKFPLGASWSCSAGITTVGRAPRPVVVRVPGTFFRHFTAPQRPSSQGSAAEWQARFSSGLAGSTQVHSGVSPARPNPSVEPTPNRVAPWPSGGYRVHFPPLGQAATLSGSPHLKRYAPEMQHLTQLAAATRSG
jgi:hypothetical protein